MDFLKLKNHLDKFLPVYVTAGMILGFLFGLHINTKAHSSLFKNLNLIVVILMIYPMMINLKLERLKNAAKLWKQLLIALIMGLVLSPILMYVLIEFVGLFVKVNPNLALGLLLAVVVPCSSMAIAYTGLTDGNIELSTIVVAISFTLAIVSVPLWIKVFASSYKINISAWLLVKTILIVVVIPMILGVLTRWYLLNKIGTENFLKLKPLFPSVSLLGMYTIVFLIFMEKSRLIASKYAVVGVALIPLILYYISALFLMIYLDKLLKLPYADHMGVTFTSVGKNEGTAMAIAMAAGMGLMAIPPAVTPIVQIPFLVGYVKIANKIKKLYNEKIDTNKLKKIHE